MKKVLFLDSFYYPKFNANGFCSNEIVKELKKKYEVYSLSYQNYNEKKYYENDGVKIYKVRPRLFFLMREYSENGKNLFFRKITKYLSVMDQKFKRILFYFNYPTTSIIATRRYLRYAKKIVEKNGINCVVAVFQPYESLITADYLKRKYGIKEIIYILDTLSNQNRKKDFFSNYKKKKGQKAEKKYYSRADMIISMRCHEKSFKDPFYDFLKGKIVYSDIPLFRKIERSNFKKIFDSEDVNMVFTGTLYKDMRDPSKACSLIEKYNVNAQNKIKMQFFSRGNCETILKKYSFVNRHGFVDHKTSINALFEADLLLSLEVKNSDMVSSKTFEYMSTGNKIIHFYETNNDVLLKYLKKYNNALLINLCDKDEKNIELIKKFIAKEKSQLEDLSKVFEENTPKYTADLMSKIIDGDTNVEF